MSIQLAPIGSQRFPPLSGSRPELRPVVVMLAVLWPAWLAATVGCSTHAHRLANPRAAFYANQLDEAAARFHELSEEPKSDQSVVELDIAMVELFQGNPSAAEQRLRQVRDTWDYLQQDNLAEIASSYAFDDQRRAYSGEDYEQVFVRVMLTLCSLIQDGVDAESYSLQTLSKQQELLAKAQATWDEDLPVDYCIPPMAPYLRGVLKEATLRDYGEASRFYVQTEALLPGAPFLLSDIQRAQNGVHSNPGNGVVYVIAMVGRGPYKEEVSQRPTQRALQAADILLSSVGEYSVPPTVAPVKIPMIVSPAKPFDLVGVEVNGKPVATTLPITDMHHMAAQTYAAKLPQVIGRAVARRIIKKGAVYAAKDKLQVNSDLTSLALDAVGVLWEASESADTRCWGLLPREIQLLRIELPAGTHVLNLEPVTAGTPVGSAVACQVDVSNGQNTYVLSYWPDLQPIGQILVSQP